MTARRRMTVIPLPRLAQLLGFYQDIEPYGAEYSVRTGTLTLLVASDRFAEDPWSEPEVGHEPPSLRVEELRPAADELVNAAVEALHADHLTDDGVVVDRGIPATACTTCIALAVRALSGANVIADHNRDRILRAAGLLPALDLSNEPPF